MKILIISFIAFLLTVFLRTELKNFKEPISPPPQGMEFYAFGFNDSISDLLWLRFIQDSYVCVQDNQCDQRWGYKMLDQATRLTPEFKSLYAVGATNISILLDDDLGAKELFDRGLAHFPTDWQINYRAGYHYLVELEQPEKAAPLFDMASMHGAPLWTRSLSARLYSKIGQLEASERILKDMQQYALDEEWEKAVKERLFEVQKKMAEQKQN